MKLSVVVVLAACSNAPATAPDAAAPAADASADSAVDSGPLYPAFTVPVVQVMTQGGPVMHDVRIVPVYWQGDAGADAVTTWLQAFAASPYYAQMTAEYGVTGGLEIATPVTLAVAAPATTTDANIQQLIASRLNGSYPAWGPVDAATIARSIYMIHYPSTTSGTGPHGQASCGFGGYHHSFAFGSGSVIYAAVYDCPSTQNAAPTAVFGHEIVEAVTDPLVGAMPAFNQLAPQFRAWGIEEGAEVGDMCEGDPSAYVTPTGFAHRLQRTWSNAAAAAFHDPCVPAPSGAYFNSIAIEPDIIDAATQLPGTQIALGQSRTIDLQLASDGPSEAWTLDGVDDTHALTFAFDPATGQNGDTVHLTITANTMPANGIVTYRIRSSIGTRRTFWTGAVSVTQ